MKLNSYPIDQPVSVKLDWVELKCLFSDFHLYRFSEYTGMLETLGEYDSDNIGVEDSGVENELNIILSHFAYRKDRLGSSYPFDICQETGIELTCEAIRSLSVDQFTYLYCLFFSHLTGSRLFELATQPSNSDRDLFQVISTLAMSGFCKGNSYSFGFPRPDGSSFYESLCEVVKLMGEGRVKSRDQLNIYIDSITPGVKDAGVDVVSWADGDGSPGSAQVYFSQVASGKNWREKSVKPDVERIQNGWMDERIYNINEAICIPFDLEYDEPEMHDAQLAALSQEFGAFLHRMRIPKNLRLGLDSAVKSPRLLVHRLSDAHKISDYVLKVYSGVKEANAA